MTITNKTLRSCGFCKNTGKHGAEFVLVAGAVETRVHKHCGEILKAQAPEGTDVRLVHWGKLRREREAAKRASEQSSAHAFWAEKFANAKPIRKDRPTTAVPLAAE